MKVTRKIVCVLAVSLSVCFGLLCVTSVSLVKGLKLIVVDANGLPLSDAFVVYEYHGDSFGFGHSGSHTRSGSITQTDENGRFRIPTKIFFRIPLVEYPEDLVIHAIWSPRTHSNGKLWYNSSGPETVEGVFEFLPKKTKLVLRDIASNHLMWFSTVQEMQSLVQDLLSGGLPPDVKAPYEIKEKLRIAVENDLTLFKTGYYNEVYQNPLYPGAGDDRNGKTYGRLMERGIF